MFDAITGRQVGIIENGVVKSMTTGAAIATISNGSGGSVDLSFITAGAEDILAGKVGSNSNGNPVNGTLPIAASPTVSGNVVTVNKGYQAEQKKVTVGTAKGAETITPGTADKTIAAGTYLTGVQTVKGDASLIPENIAEGIEIFGVAGTFIGGNSMEFYKCAAVSGLEDAYLVSGAGTEAVNGNYLKTGQTYSGQDIWKHETADYYMFFDNVNAYPNRWIIADNCPPNSFTTLYALIVTTDNPAQPGWSYSQGLREPPTVSKTQIRTGEDTWSGYKAVLADGVYSFEETVTEGLSYTSVTPKIGKTYSADALVEAYFPQTNSIVDQHTVYAVSGGSGMTELVSGTALTNSGGTVIAEGAFDFAASGSVLDFAIADDAKWHMADFTMEVVCTPCQPSFSYPTVLATGDNWENNAMMLRFGNQGNRSIGYFWTGIGDPVTQGGDITYSNSEFYHMAICRLGNRITIYANGTAVATATRDQVWNAASDNIIRLGALDLGSAKYVGKVRWARISNIARYTADFDASDLINGNTPDSPDNGNDTPSDKTYLYTVSGAGTAEANGDYWETGDGTYTNGTCTMFFESASGDWYLGADPTAPYYYRMGGNPLGNWTVFKGTAPAPTVVEYAG